MRTPKITRRTSIAALASGLLPLHTRAQSNRKIIVIGAGLAGLSTARALHNAGVEALVLEACNRIGGRIWTSRPPPGASRSPSPTAQR